jgi:hypothetical protein
MRQPSCKLLLAFVLAAAFAVGCGDDDEPANGGAASQPAEQAENGEKADDGDGAASAKPADKPKKQSARAEMVECIEDEGFDVSHKGDDEEKATNYTVEAGGKKKAEIIIHSNENDAAGAAKKAGEEKAINSIPFGRVEFRNNDDATNTEAGVLANCVAEAYVH